jgi:hypothetical protein
MRNIGKTSAIDYGSYRSIFDVILSPMVRSLASHDRHGVEFDGRTLEQGWRQQEAPTTWWNLGGS